MFWLQRYAMALLIGAAMVSAPDLLAADKTKMLEGIVVSANSGKLVIVDHKYRTHTHTVDSSAQIMVEGKMGTLEDVARGLIASVTLDSDKVIFVSAIKPTRAANGSTFDRETVAMRSR